MRRSPTIARLRAEQVEADETARRKTDTADYRQLRALRQLDERLEESKHAPLLSDLDRAILDQAMVLGYIGYSKIGDALELDRGTVWHRVERLLASAAYLQRFAETLLGEAPPLDWPFVKAMATAYAHHSTASTSASDGLLGIDDFNRLSRMSRGGVDARRLLYPPIGPRIARQGAKLVITGPGPLDPILRDAIRAGKAERIFDPPRCHGCGRLIGKPYRGRPRKWCSGARGERCRKRVERRRSS